jgi:hypothetical protein
MNESKSSMTDEELPEGVYVVEAILGHQVETNKELFLVKWSGYDSFDDLTWEPVENLDNCKEMIDLYWSKQRAVVHAHPRAGRLKQLLTRN